MFTFGVASVCTVCPVSLAIMLALLYVFFQIASKAILYVVLMLGKSHLMKGLRIFIHLRDFPSILGAVAFEL